MDLIKIENGTFADESTDEEPAENEFYFESDHLALRGDPDYAAVLRTIAILQAQRIQATKDIDKIAAAEKDALEEPEMFLKRLTNGEPLNLPGPINVLEVSTQQNNIFFYNYSTDCFLEFLVAKNQF